MPSSAASRKRGASAAVAPPVGLPPAVAALVSGATPSKSFRAAPAPPWLDTRRSHLIRESFVQAAAPSGAPAGFANVTPSSHASFAAVELPECESWTPSDMWLTSTEPPERTSDGELVRFPWLQEHKGQIFSASRSRGAHPLDRLVNLGLDNAARDGQRGVTHTGVRAWHAFMRDEMGGAPPDRPMEASAPLWAKLSEEWLAMRFVCALVESRGISVKSAANYWGAVQGWHLRTHGVKIGGGMRLARLPQMLKGLRRVFGDTERRVRRGIGPQALRKAMDMVLDPDVPAHANIRAALATALQGLLRSSEFALDPGKTWDPKLHISRGDIRELTASRMTLMIAPCKSSEHLAGKTCALVIGGGGEFVDAVAEVRNMLRVDPLLPGQDPRKVPLFRVPGTCEPLRTDFVLNMTRRLMAAIGEPPEQYGTHSYRIGGATALFAAGADVTVIRTMGRWNSDIHQLYVRACYERCCDWSRRAGSTRVTDVAHFDEVADY